ncbi:MAG: NYN domain-containing protein [Chloroflexota bacterium]|nr:NYN domain-containing protein [Chloroflexota bacterium]
MPYLIDGHNLIPTIPGLSLKTLDDEIQLIQYLQAFQRQSRKRVEVYFDNAPPGQARTQTYGSLKAHFVRRGRTADAAIMARLRKLGGDARTWTVVSSDGEVLAAARAAHARVIRSDEFARRLSCTPKQESSVPEAKPDVNLSADEVDEWLRLFRGNAD